MACGILCRVFGTFVLALLDEITYVEVVLAKDGICKTLCSS